MLWRASTRGRPIGLAIGHLRRSARTLHFRGFRRVSLRHALLGVLKDKPLTGYDLVRHFQGTVGFLWSAPQSQIYPELRRMEADGLIIATVAPRGQRAQKGIYSVTDCGMTELRRWAKDFMPLPAQRDPITLKAAFFDLAPLDAAREQLRAHIA